MAAPKDTLALLDNDVAVAAKRGSLIAETVAAADGSFAFQLGVERNYEGGPFEIDVYCSTVPHRKPTKTPPPPVQFSITTLQPLWKQTDAGALAYWEYCVPARFWCGIRHKLGAWTICGRVLICDAPQPTPIAGVKVKRIRCRLDAGRSAGIRDHQRDRGYFRIDYLAIDFMRTPFPFLNIELFGGPDLYFYNRGDRAVASCCRSRAHAGGTATGRTSVHASAWSCASTSPRTPSLTHGSPMSAILTSTPDIDPGTGPAGMGGAGRHVRRRARGGRGSASTTGCRAKDPADRRLPDAIPGRRLADALPLPLRQPCGLTSPTPVPITGAAVRAIRN